MAVLQAVQWGDTGVALYRASSPSGLSHGVVGLEMGFGGWHATAGGWEGVPKPPEPFRLECGGGDDAHGHFTAVYGLPPPSWRGTLTATFHPGGTRSAAVTGHGALLAVPYDATVRNNVLRDRGGRVVDAMAWSCG